MRILNETKQENSTANAESAKLNVGLYPQKTTEYCYLKERQQTYKIKKKKRKIQSTSKLV